jgi:hypothetical protein
MHPAFDEVCVLLKELLDVEVPLSDRAALRASASATATQTPETGEAPPVSPEPPRAVLEAEVVAIYW